MKDLAVRCSGRAAWGGRIWAKPIVASAFLVVAVPAIAAQSSSVTLEEVIVTGQKRVEEISKVPLSISALSAAALDRSGIEDVAGLSTSVPGLQISRSGQDTSLGIRGIRSTNTSELGNPAVAMYVDGVYVPRTSSMTQQVYDIERIEVLRGPQGTLFGRNATAGAVSIISAPPKPDFDASADVAFGNYEAVTARGMINLPVSDSLFLRGSFVHDVNDGYFDSLGTASTNYYNADQTGGRIAALWTPSADLQWQLSVNYLHDRGTPPLWIPISPRDEYGIYDRPVGRNGKIDKDLLDVRSKLLWQLSDRTAITYYAGYSEEDSFNQYAFGSTENTLRFVMDFSSYSHELNFNYDTDWVNAVAGLYYFHEEPRGEFFATGPVRDVQFYFYETSQGSQAVFGQATFHATDRLRLTGGLRYSEDEASLPTEPLYSCPRFSAPTPDAPGCSFLIDIGGPKDEWSKLTWKATADFDVTEDSLLYATVSLGYKAGGLAARGAPTYGPENVTNYEIGSKSRFLDGRLSLGASAYFMDYQDLQVSVVRIINPLAGNQLVTVNAGKATVKGAELETSWLATADDRIDGFVSWLDAKYDEFAGAVDTFISATEQLDLSGNRLPKAPRFSARLSYGHTFHFAGGATLVPQLSVYWQSKMYLREFNRPEDVNDEYTKADVTLRFTSASGQWFAEGYVYNVGDEDVRNNAAVNNGVLYASYDPPRIFGARIGYRY